MAAAGPQPQTFDWPDLDYPATLSEVCGSLAPSPTSGHNFDVAAARWPNSPAELMQMRMMEGGPAPDLDTSAEAHAPPSGYFTPSKAGILQQNARQAPLHGKGP